jgi:hypothetical protein
MAMETGSAVSNTHQQAALRRFVVIAVPTAVVVASAGAAFAHPSLAAAIRPEDQGLAKRLSLRLEGFTSGWTRATAPSTKLGRTPSL